MSRFILLFLASIVLFSSGCKFPDNIPDWQNLGEFQFERLEFGKTTTDELKLICQGVKSQKMGNKIEIFTFESPDINLYKRIRVGFNNNKLDWVEFAFSNKLELASFLDVYDRPVYINSDYSRILDYYDYNFFNIAVDKSHTEVKSLNIFKLNPSDKPKNIIKRKTPDYKTILKSGLWDLVPGVSFENDFREYYQPYEKLLNAGDESISTYILTAPELKKYYKKVSLNYNNGLLSWINLEPVSLLLVDAVKILGKQAKVEKINDYYSLYDYGQIILTVDNNHLYFLL